MTKVPELMKKASEERKLGGLSLPDKRIVFALTRGEGKKKP